MKSKLQLMHDDLKNIIGGFKFYLDKDKHPVLSLSEKETKLIKSYEFILTSSIASISPSGEPSSEVSIYLTKRFLEIFGFKNTLKEKIKYEK